MRPSVTALLQCALCFASAKAFSIASLHSSTAVTISNVSPSKVTLRALPRIFYDDEPYDKVPNDEPELWTNDAMESIALWTNELEQALQTEATSASSNFVKLISTPYPNTNPSDWDIRLTMGGGSSGAAIQFYAVILGPAKYHLGVALDDDIDAETLQVEIIGNGNLLLTAKRTSDGLKPHGRKVPVLVGEKHNDMMD